MINPWIDRYYKRLNEYPNTHDACGLCFEGRPTRYIIHYRSTSATNVCCEKCTSDIKAGVLIKNTFVSRKVKDDLIYVTPGQYLLGFDTSIWV